MPRIDSFVQLSDKWSLAYAEYGDSNGVPFFLFHGLPGSRLSWGLIPNHPFPPGLRIIAPDRPGYGRSDPQPVRTAPGLRREEVESRQKHPVKGRAPEMAPD